MTWQQDIMARNQAMFNQMIPQQQPMRPMQQPVQQPMQPVQPQFDVSKYRQVNMSALGDDVFSQALKSKAQQFGNAWGIENSVADYYQNLAKAAEGSKIGYYGMHSLADMPTDVQLLSMRQSNPAANLMVGGKEMRYVPYEAGARIWGDSQGGLSGVLDYMGNENLFKRSVVSLPDEIVKQLNFKDYLGSDYQFENPGLGYLMTDAELAEVFGQVGTSNDVTGFDNYQVTGNPYAKNDTFKGAWLQRMTPEVRAAFNKMAPKTKASNDGSEWYAMGSKDFSGSSQKASWLNLDTDGGNINSNYWWQKQDDPGLLGKVAQFAGPVLSFINPVYGAAWNLGAGLGSGNIGQAVGGLLGMPGGALGSTIGSGLTSGISNALGGGALGNALGNAAIGGTLSKLSGGDALKGALGSGLGNFAGSQLNGLDAFKNATPIMQNALMGATKGGINGLLGGNLQQGLLSGALSGGLKGIGNQMATGTDNAFLANLMKSAPSLAWQLMQQQKRKGG